MKGLAWVVAVIVALCSAYVAEAAPKQANIQLAGGQNYVPNKGNNPPSPVKPPCPKGTVGKWPACIPLASPRCPRGTIGKWPLCHRPSPLCPKGTRRVGKKCVAIDNVGCPKGLTRVGKKCVKTPAQPGPTMQQQTEPEHCPDNTVGKWPHCTSIAAPCPAGQVRKAGTCEALAGARQNGSAGASPPPAFTPPQPGAVPARIAELTGNRPHRPREILVLVATADAAAISARLAQTYNVIAEPPVANTLLASSIVRLRLVDNRALEPLLAAIAAEPGVTLAQPNYDYEASEAAAAPAVGIAQYAPAKLRLAEAHRIARGKGVKVAIIDTAIEAAHPELEGAVTAQFELPGGTRPRPEPHGTAIAGIVAAHASLTGAAPEAKLLSVPAFSGGKGARAQSTSLILLGSVDWAFASGAKVMNMSFTGPSDPLIERIIETAAGKGAIFVGAAGNAGPDSPPLYPAAYEHVIGVTATDEQDTVYADANRGDYVTIAAPGVDIVVPSVGGAYDVMSGTSMAAAYVSGIIALVLERKPDLDARAAASALASSARKPPGDLPDDAIGAGIVDAAAALAAP